MNYTFDAMGRPYTLAQAGGSTFVTQATYWPSGAPSVVSAFGINNWWTYNSMLQVTQTAQDGIQMTYGYSATQNNGKVAWAKDATLGETVNYTYDLLNRLASAAATDNAWGNGYVYDGYGNLLQKTVTAGSAPSLSQAVNVGNNQIVGMQYDANGNQTSVYIAGTGNVQLTYDLGNRVTRMAGAGAVTLTTRRISGCGGRRRFRGRRWRCFTFTGSTGR